MLRERVPRVPVLAVASLGLALSLLLLAFGSQTMRGGQQGRVELVQVSEIVLSETPELVLGDVQRAVFDADGNIWVLDWGSESLIRYEPGGGNPHLVAGRGQGPGELLQPGDLSIGPDGHVFVANMFGRITEFDASGRYLNSFVPLGSNIPVTWLHVDGDGILYVAGRRRLPGNILTLFTREGEPLRRSLLENHPRVYEQGLHTFSGARCTDAGAELLCVQPTSYEVSVVAKDGSSVRRFGRPTSHYRKGGGLSSSDRTSIRKMRRFKRNFTYVMDVFTSGDVAVVASRNDAGGAEPLYEYFLDFYSQPDGELLGGSVPIPGPLEAVSGDLLYVLSVEPAASGAIKNALQVYRYHVH